MKPKFLHFIFILTLHLSILLFPANYILAQVTWSAKTVSVKPIPNNQFLLNPNKGWVIYSNFDNASKEAWEKASVGYSRFTWIDLHIGENKYNWKPIDDALNTCISRGKKLGFGVMTCYVNSAIHYRSMPQWVIDSGAKFYFASGAGMCKVPIWNDSIFLSKMSQFVLALKERYNGNKNIAFIDNRIYGNWGEWHLAGLGGNDPGEERKKSFVDLYSIFDKTIIIQLNSDREGSYAGGFANYARDTYNMGWREDSADDLYRKYTCFNSSKTAPNIAEWSTNYNNLKNGKGWTGKYWTDEMVSESILGSRYTYMNLGQWNGEDANIFLKEKAYLVNEWQNKMGYWFKPTAFDYPIHLGNGDTGTIYFTLSNEGVAPLCTKASQPCVKMALLNTKNEVLQTSLLTNIDPMKWFPSTIIKDSANFFFPKSGEDCKLAFGVFSDRALVHPDIKLGMNGGDSNNWYILNDMESKTVHIELEVSSLTPIIYPNPVESELNIDLGQPLIFDKINIFDPSERIVMSQSCQTNLNTIVVKDLPAGIYLLSASGRHNKLQLKFIKK